MTSLGLLTTDDLHHLAVALRSGRVFPPFSAIQLKPFVPATVADTLAGELRQKVEAGFEPGQLDDFLDLLSQDRRRRPVAEDLIDLVWTGPEAAGIVNRDTAVVVRELFQHAKESVLVAGYAVHEGHVVFKTLADRMDQISELDVRMFLDIHPQSHASGTSSEAVRQFAEHFARHEWPGKRLPEVYYDPRSLEAEPSKRASLHAKCIVVDREVAFVSSANFTEAAHTRNIEVGVLFKSRSFAKRLSDHFEALAATQTVKPVPLS
jgi:hypothetical protein